MLGHFNTLLLLIEKKYIAFICLALAALGHGWLAYYTPRTALAGLGISLLLAWIGYLGLVYTRQGTMAIWYQALALRMVWLWAIPALSDDVYRFVWDGLRLIDGHNPFGQLPSEIGRQESLSPLASYLLANMNSPDYYTVYPPVCQVFFGLSAWVSREAGWLWGIVTLRLSMMAVEVYGLWHLRRLSQGGQIPAWGFAIFALNPLVISEGIGNLHPESAMVGWLIASIAHLSQGQTKRAACLFALSVCTKLLPLLVVPLVLPWLGWRRGVQWLMVVGVLTTLAFMPFLWYEWPHILQSLGLYFHTFAFNGSVYYALRALGLSRQWLAVVPLLALPAILVLAWPWWRTAIARQGQALVLTIPQFGEKALSAWGCYLLLATTVHPWYLIPPVLLGSLSGRLWPVAWSGLVLLSYHAYAKTPYRESGWLIVLQYGLLALAVFLEQLHIRRNKADHLIRPNT